MTDIQEQIVQILGKMLFDAPIEWSDPSIINWDALLGEGIQQAVFPILFEYAESSMPAGSIHDKYLKYDIRYTRNNIRNLYYHNRLHLLMEENEIPYVMLKGQVSASYYPEPIKRPMGDIDFLIEPKDLHKAENLFISEGYMKSEKSADHEFHWAYKKRGVKFEVHWEAPGIPMKDNVIRSYMRDIIDRRVLVNGLDRMYYVPSTFHHGVILLLHTISHLTASGIGLRHLCDWLVFQNSLSEDDFIAIFSEPLKKMGLWKLAAVMTKIGILYFGCEEREWCREADAQLCEEFLNDIFVSGNFGTKDKSRSNQVMLIRNVKTKEVSNRDFLHNAVLSVDKKAVQDYPICDRVPVLRPIVWIIVLIQYYMRVRAGKKNNILSRESLTSALRRQQIYAELELYLHNDTNDKGDL